MDSYPLVVIGSGPGGVGAAEFLAPRRASAGSNVLWPAEIDEAVVRATGPPRRAG